MTARPHPPAFFPPPEPEAVGRWMTIRQIAADVAVSPSTVYKWSARGGPRFPRAIRLRNGDVWVRRDWYESWLGEPDNRTGHLIPTGAIAAIWRTGRRPTKSSSPGILPMAEGSPDWPWPWDSE